MLSIWRQRHTGARTDDKALDVTKILRAEILSFSCARAYILRENDAEKERERERERETESWHGAAERDEFLIFAAQRSACVH